uniref:Uncharacterized protein n=1 Tax=Arundo donax TaxID=35708 RepID=A0A0A9AMC0_ARUDO
MAGPASELDHRGSACLRRGTPPRRTGHRHRFSRGRARPHVVRLPTLISWIGTVSPPGCCSIRGWEVVAAATGYTDGGGRARRRREAGGDHREADALGKKSGGGVARRELQGWDEWRCHELDGESDWEGRGGGM